MPVTPQVEYTGPPISDTTNWTAIEGCYTAQGDEEFLTIGNFRGDSSTQVTDTADDDNKTAYYYLDDVSVVPAGIRGLPSDGDTTVCPHDSVRLSTVTDSITDYEWSPSRGLSSDTVSDPLASPDTTTTYTLTKRTLCDTTTAQVTVKLRPTPTVELPHDRCVQMSDSLELAPDSLSKGTLPSWSPSIGLDDTASSATTLKRPDSTRTYTLTVKDTSNGCRSSDSVRVVPSKDWPRDSSLQKGDSLRYFLNDPSGLAYLWQPSSLVSDPNDRAPYLFPDTSTAFRLTKESACDTATGSFLVIVDEPVGNGRDRSLFIPNVFAPDARGDAENRRFRVRGGPFETYHLQIFSRWGELVFETKDPGDAWKGRYKGEPMEAGVYTYQFRGKLKSGEKVERSGEVTLLR